MNNKHIKVEKRDGICIITINRPEARNALSLVMLEAIEAAFKDAEMDDDIFVVVFTGAGDRAFSAGLDLTDLKSFMDAEEGSDVLFAGDGAFRAIQAMKKPVIAAVNGYAVTGGLELVLSCDIIIASDTAKFGDTHAKVGVTPGAGMSQILPRVIGVYKAKQMSFTGEFIDAQEAHTAGLVGKVVPANSLMEEAIKMAETIRSCNQETVVRIKRMIDEGGKLTLEGGMTLEAREFAEWKRGIKR